MPQDMPMEMRRHIQICVETYDTHGQLLHCQRLMLFRAICAYMYKFTNMSEKTVQNFTLHILYQLIWDYYQDQDAPDDDARLPFKIEPAETSLERYQLTIPRWLVRGLEVYNLAVRPHFLLAEPQKIFTRFFVDGSSPVVTERLLINSSGNTKFRLSTVSEQYLNVVRHKLTHANSEVPLHTIPFN